MKTFEPSGTRAGFVLLLVFALLAAAFGFLALLGWVLELPRLASFGADLIPMAPSTAVLFLLFGVATGLRGRTPLSRRVFWISVAAGCFGALAALLLFVLSCLNIHWAVEHLGLNVTGTVGGAPKGHISPVAAFFFLLASVSFLASLSQSVVPRWRAALASGSAGVLLATCFIFLLAYLYGAPLLYGGMFIPPALNTVLAFTMLGLALLVSAVRSSGPREGQPKDVPTASYVFLLIFILLATGIVTVGYLYYRHYEKQYRAEVEHQLSAVADLKVSELTRWRKERMADGAVFFKNPSFSALVRRFFTQPADADAQRQLRDWLGKYPTFCDCNQLRLIDTQDVTRLSVPSGLNPATSDTLRMTAEVLRSGQIALQDFYRHERDRRAYLQVMVPILDELNTSRPLGVLELRLDPSIFLYPLIQHWPTPSQTAETLLVRREGNEVVFLNELRFQTNTALNLRAPLDRVALPAAQAALGREGIFEGIDYRGVPVVAALHTIPDSPWSLVSKMDIAEVYGPMRERLWQVVIMVGILLFGAGTGVGLVWRHQRSRFYKERAQATEAVQQSARELQEKNAELERFLYTASHDLKSPVVTVRTFLGYLEQDVAAADAGRIEKDLRFIRAATDKMGQLLDELLEISRIGRVASPPVSITLRKLVDEALGAVAGRIAERGMTVKVGDADMLLRGDRARMAEIWQNLVENACKFMGDQKKPRVEIGVEARGAETVFFVRDNGIGIDPRYHAKVFGLFEKLDPRAEGTGLGLALAKRIVELYQGRIWVESLGQGQGACFYFTLPGAVGKQKSEVSGQKAEGSNSKE